MKIEIPNLCHEDWNAMTENSCGRFCQSCQKTVHDFTQKTPAEIEAFFNQNRGGEVCGRFRSEQLERHYQFLTPTPLWYPASKIAAIILASAMLTSSSGCFMGAAANPNEFSQNIDNVVFIDAKPLQGEVSITQNMKKLSGVVKDEKGNPLVGVKITVDDLHLMVASDVGGAFLIYLPKNTAGVYTLNATKSDYETTTAKFNTGDFVENALQMTLSMKTKTNCTKPDANVPKGDEIKMGKFVPAGGHKH